MSGTYNITVGDRGRLVLPAEVRDRSGLDQGTELVLMDLPGGLLLLTRDQLKARVRESLAGTDPVEALLVDRRAAAASEDSG